MSYREITLSELNMTNSLGDEFKRRFISEYHNNYTPWELETLLKNGKNSTEFIFFKKALIKFLEEHYEMCSVFHSKLKDVDDEYKLVSLLEKFADDIYTELGGTEINELEDKVIGLNTKITKLEKEVGHFEVLINDNPSLEDEYKIKVFGEHYNEYTSWELEKLLQNGKELLKKL